MDSSDKIWLVSNSASGSNTPAAMDGLYDVLARNGIAIERHVSLPDDPLPEIETLDAAGAHRLVVYGGDGTITSTINALCGWGGSILPLPGGTMNLLCKRLHGNRSIEDIVEVVACNHARAARPNICKTAGGLAMVSVLAGPGSRWGEVRESMRQGDIAGMASKASETISDMEGAAMVCVANPEAGKPDGYPMLEIAPGEFGLRVDAYDAKGALDYASHTLALLRRNFREGPHLRLGLFEALTLKSVDGSPLELLLDGESWQGSPSEEIALARCDVDLLATGHGD